MKNLTLEKLTLFLKEGEEPAKTIAEAKKYFGDGVIYYDGGKMIGESSTLIKLKNRKLEIIRKGADYDWRSFLLNR